MKRHSEEEYSERLDEDSSDLIYSQTNLNNEEPSCSNFRIIPGYSDKIDLYPIASNNSRTIPRVLQLVDPINGEDSKLMKIDFGLHSQPTGQGGFSSVYKGEIISPDETDPLVISGQKDFAFKIVRSDLSDYFYWLCRRHYSNEFDAIKPFNLSTNHTNQSRRKSTNPLKITCLSELGP
eukprot:TRINITY_DN1475_c0_g1_i1.p1 TRINITY_DN1475_c0_g1~~TRINITY_DN1475_c0_g1_i1.p1  ORF type:complete len:179 (+),score=20.93 TRINITY_DN1475_c0_g1_i1:230-766(+)